MLMTTENASTGSGQSLAGEATDVVAAPLSDVRLRTGLLRQGALWKTIGRLPDGKSL